MAEDRRDNYSLWLKTWLDEREAAPWSISILLKPKGSDKAELVEEDWDGKLAEGTELKIILHPVEEPGSIRYENRMGHGLKLVSCNLSFGEALELQNRIFIITGRMNLHWYSRAFYLLVQGVVLHIDIKRSDRGLDSCLADRRKRRPISIKRLLDMWFDNGYMACDIYEDTPDKNSFSFTTVFGRCSITDPPTIKRRFEYSADFRSISLGDERFDITSRQADIIKVLYELSKKDLSASKEYLLEEIGGGTWKDAWRSRQEALKKLIVPGDSRGTVRLNVDPDMVR